MQKNKWKVSCAHEEEISDNIQYPTVHVGKGFWEVYNLAMLCFLKRDFEEGKEYFNRFLQILKASFYVGELYIEWHEELYNHCIEQLCPELESEETAYKMVCDMITRRRNFFSSKPSYKKLKKEFRWSSECSRLEC